LVIATVKTVLVAMFFMHLVEQPGSRRLIFPVAVLYVALLLGISLLEVMTRYRPAVQGGLTWCWSLRGRRLRGRRLTACPGTEGESASMSTRVWGKPGFLRQALGRLARTGGIQEGGGEVRAYGPDRPAQARFSRPVLER